MKDAPQQIAEPAELLLNKTHYTPKWLERDVQSACVDDWM